MNKYFYTSKDGIIKSKDKFTSGYLGIIMLMAGGAGLTLGVTLFVFLIIPLLVITGARVLLDKLYDGLNKTGRNSCKNK